MEPGARTLPARYYTDADHFHREIEAIHFGDWLCARRSVQLREPEFWDLTNRQDWELSDLAQRAISSRGYQPGPYSNREELLLALDRWVLERVAG